MRGIICNYRYWVLTVLCGMTVIGAVAVPDESLPTLAWVAVLLLSKVAAVVTGCAFCLLYERWNASVEL